MTHARTRLLRTAAALVVTTALGVAGAGGAQAHTDRERAEKMRTEYSAGLSVPLISSPNVRLVATRPGSAGISGCFMKTAPLFVMSSLDSIKVFDVSDPLNPRLTGTLPSLQFENEAMNCGERRTAEGTKRFVLVGVDLYQTSPDDIQHSNVGGGELVLVDVTDPTRPHIRSRATGSTSTHTVACVADTDCRYAYSAGDGSPGQPDPQDPAPAFSIFDLTDIDQPFEVDSVPGGEVEPFPSPAAGHKWNFDDAGFASHTGWNGTAIFDVSDPVNPVQVAFTGPKYFSDYGESGDSKHTDGFNDFIHHNSLRPNAAAFRPDAPPSFANGNVLLVTEEDYEQTDCSLAGSFQTWHVRRLDGSAGAIVPLDKVELADLGTFPVPQYAFCSAHWFDYHPSGIIAIGFYGGGTQFVDVRNPRELSSYGHATWGVSEVWDAYWVPVYNKNGVATGRKTNLAYSVDLVRGLDVYAVTLPGSPQVTNPVTLTTTNPYAGLSWPEDAMPILVVTSALVAVVLLRRRSAHRPATERRPSRPHTRAVGTASRGAIRRRVPSRAEPPLRPVG